MVIIAEKYEETNSWKKQRLRSFLLNTDQVMLKND